MKFKMMKKVIASFVMVACIATMLPATSVQAEGETVRSVYTNEVIPAAQAQTRPIAIMMPTDNVAQPSFGSARRKYYMKLWKKEIFRDSWR